MDLFKELAEDTSSGAVASFTTTAVGPGGPGGGPIRVGGDKDKKQKPRLDKPRLLSCFVAGYKANCKKK